MKKLIVLFLMIIISACKSDPKVEKQTNTDVETTKTEIAESSPVEITPLQHATFIMTFGEEVIYFDPTGGKESFEGLPKPTLVLITDIHGDHFNNETLLSLPDGFDIVAPRAVYSKMPAELQNKTKTLDNGESIKFHNFKIDGIPMYNITEERQKFHEKGRGNGYVVSQDGFRVYVSGDTEDIPEMRSLKDIDLAFICMNLPYTMTPEAAANATLEFQPKTVIPYHYRGLKNGETHYYDVEKFKAIVNEKNKDIVVDLMEWYPEK